MELTDDVGQFNYDIGEDDIVEESVEQSLNSDEQQTSRQGSITEDSVENAPEATVLSLRRLN